MTAVNGQHVETIPRHGDLKPGLLLALLKRIAAHHDMTVAELITRIDL